MISINDMVMGEKFFLDVETGKTFTSLKDVRDTLSITMTETKRRVRSRRLILCFACSDYLGKGDKIENNKIIRSNQHPKADEK